VSLVIGYVQLRTHACLTSRFCRIVSAESPNHGKFFNNISGLPEEGRRQWPVESARFHTQILYAAGAVMSIDGIGGPPRIGPLNPSGAAAPTEGTEAFRVDAGGAAAPVEQTLIARLERGEISLDAYLDQRVEEAVAPFSAKLDQNALSFMRSSLREQLSADPVLVELVRRATQGVTTP